MNEFLISEIEEKDLPEVFSLANNVLEKQVFPILSSEGIDTIRKNLDSDTSDILNKAIYQALKIKIDDKIVGYIAWRHGYYIAQLYVASEYQRHGIGTRLLDEVRKRAGVVNLKVRASLNAVDFYLKYGFTAEGSASEINNIRFLPMEFKVDS